MDRPPLLPFAVKIGSVPYALTYGPINQETARIERDDLEDLSGLVVHRDGNILVSDNTPHPEVLRDTVLHEILHGIFFMSGIYRLGEDDEAEEIMCVRLTQWLLQLIRDNPQLISYLTAHG